MTRESMNDLMERLRGDKPSIEAARRDPVAFVEDQLDVTPEQRQLLRGLPRERWEIIALALRSGATVELPLFRRRPGSAVQIECRLTIKF
jgi:hypothetical protein